ncbi:hypothetical protein ES703_49255 [subsurface metagenome]
MLKYTRHARQMMKQRSISEEEVEHCLNDHDIFCTDKKGNPKYRARTPDGRDIKVVLKKENPSLVITVED